MTFVTYQIRIYDASGRDVARRRRLTPDAVEPVIGAFLGLIEVGGITVLIERREIPGR